MHPSSRALRRTICLAGLAVATVTVPLLAADPRARILAGNTLLLAGAVSAASVALGTPLAFLLARTDMFGRRLAVVLLLALLFMPLYLQAAAWQAGFGVSGWCTLTVAGAPLLDGWSGAIAIHTLAAIPWVVVIVGMGLRWVEPELEEEALLDGTPWQVFRRVTLRRSADALAAAFLWVAVTTAGEMTVTDLFQIRTYAEELYTEFALAAPPLSWLPSAVAVGWAILAGLLLTSLLVSPDRQASPRRGYRFRLGRWRALLSVATLGAVVALVSVGASNLVVQAGRLVTRGDLGLVRGWSARQCATMIAGSPLRFSREFGWSLAIGALAATVAVAIGLPLAWQARRGGWRAAPAFLTIAICLALPGPMVGLGLIACFSAADWAWLAWLYDHSIAAIAIAQTIRALPLSTLVLWYALRTIPDELLDSATLDGATPWVRFFAIVLPQRWPAVAAAWLVALAIAWGELSASILVVPPGVITLPIQIFGLIHYGVDDQVAGVSLAVMAMFCVIAVLLSALIRLADRAD